MKILKSIQFDSGVSRVDSLNQEFYQEIADAQKELKTNTFEGFNILHKDNNYGSFSEFIMSRCENDLSSELFKSVYKTGLLNNIISLETTKKVIIKDKRIDWEALSVNHPKLSPEEAIAEMYPELVEKVLNLRLGFNSSIDSVLKKNEKEFSSIFNKKLSEYFNNFNFVKSEIPTRLIISRQEQSKHIENWDSEFRDQETQNALFSLMVAVPSVACQDSLIKHIKGEQTVLNELSMLLLSGKAPDHIQMTAIRNSLLSAGVKKDINEAEYYNIYNTINAGDKTLEEIDTIIGNIQNLEEITKKIQNNYSACLVFAMNNPDHAKKMIEKYPSIINDKLYLTIENGHRTPKDGFTENHAAIIEALPKDKIKEHFQALVQVYARANKLTLLEKSANKIGLSIENGDDYSAIFYAEDKHKILNKNKSESETSIKGAFAEAVEVGYNPGRILKMVQTAVKNRQDGKTIITAYKKNGLIDTKNITFLTAISACTDLTSIFETYKTPINADIYNKQNFDKTPFWWNTKDTFIVNQILLDSNKSNYTVNVKGFDLWDKLSLNFHRNETKHGFGTSESTNLNGLNLFNFAVDVAKEKNEKIFLNSNGSNILHDVLSHSTYNNAKTYQIFETLAVYQSKFDFNFKEALHAKNSSGLYPIDKFLDIRSIEGTREDLAFAIEKQKVTANNNLIEKIFHTLSQTSPDFVYEFLNAPNHSEFSTYEHFKHLGKISNNEDGWQKVEVLYNHIILGQTLDNYAQQQSDVAETSKNDGERFKL